MHGHLGLIPQYQFSSDPDVNPYLNRYVSMPDGMTQAFSVQPYGSSMTPITVPMPSPLYGAGLGYPMIDHPPLDGVTGWAWEHRKGIAVGVVALVGLSLLGGLSALLR